MLDLLQTVVISENLDSYIAKFFDTGPAVDLISKKLLSSSSFNVPIAMLAQRKADTAIAQ